MTKVRSDFWCDNSSMIYLCFLNLKLDDPQKMLLCDAEGPHVFCMFWIAKERIKPTGCWQHLVGSCYIVLEERCRVSSHLETMLRDCCELWSAEPWQMPPLRFWIDWLVCEKNTMYIYIYRPTWSYLHLRYGLKIFNKNDICHRYMHTACFCHKGGGTCRVASLSLLRNLSISLWSYATLGYKTMNLDVFMRERERDSCSSHIRQKVTFHRPW